MNPRASPAADTHGRRLRAHFGGYLVSGGLAATIDLLLFYWLHARLHSVPAAAAASFCVAITVNYLLSSRFVYRQPWSSARRVGLFAGFASLGLFINAGTTWALSEVPGIPVELAKLGGIALAFCANYALNTLVVFRPSAASRASTRG